MGNSSFLPLPQGGIENPKNKCCPPIEFLRGAKFDREILKIWFKEQACILDT